MHPARVLRRAELAEPVGRRLVEDPVGLVVLDRRHLGLDAEAELLDDRVRVAFRLGVLRPLLEVRVANELDLLVRRVLLEHVWPSARRRNVDVLGRRRRREDERERYGELVEELRVCRRQMEGDVVAFDDHALRQVAGCRRLDARVAALDDVVPGARVGAVADLEETLEGRQHVLARERLAVRELDPRAKLEGPGLAAVRRLRDRLRQIGHELCPLGSARTLEGDEAVVRENQELPLGQRVVDLRVG